VADINGGRSPQNIYCYITLFIPSLRHSFTTLAVVKKHLKVPVLLGSADLTSEGVIIDHGKHQVTIGDNTCEFTPFPQWVQALEDTATTHTVSSELASVQDDSTTRYVHSLVSLPDSAPDTVWSWSDTAPLSRLSASCRRYYLDRAYATCAEFRGQFPRTLGQPSVSRQRRHFRDQVLLAAKVQSHDKYVLQRELKHPSRLWASPHGGTYTSHYGPLGPMGYGLAPPEEPAEALSVGPPLGGIAFSAHGLEIAETDLSTDPEGNPLWSSCLPQAQETSSEPVPSHTPHQPELRWCRRTPLHVTSISALRSQRPCSQGTRQASS
jgi:hypothetical protein